MARLADEILRELKPAPWINENQPLPRTVGLPLANSHIYAQEVIRNEPIIDVSNVADYTWASRENWSTTDKDQFPCLTPPFPAFFMEYRRPPIFAHERDDLHTDEAKAKWGKQRVGNNWVDARTDGWPIDRYGVLFDSIDLSTQTIDDLPLPMAGPDGKNMLETLIPERARWVLRGQLFIKEKGEKAKGPVAFWIGALNGDGVLMQDAVVGMPFANLMDREERFYWSTMLTSCFQAPLRAISYMHCKNIKQETQTPNAKQSKRWEKKSRGNPLMSYRTLVIEPLVAGGRKGGNGGTGGGGAKSHHFVRGHFADYREKGLFGKHKGIFWFDVHVRGSKAVGTVEGDIEVRTPKAS